VGILVIAFSGSTGTEPFLFRRFTVYDFMQMKRRSYHPHTQIVSTMTATSSTGASLSRPTTPLAPLGESPPLPNDFEMGEKELLPQGGGGETYDTRHNKAAL